MSCFHSARCDGCCCDGAKSLIRKNRQPGSARGDGGACGGAKSLIRKNRHSGFASACASDGGACGGRACDGAPAMGTRGACASDGGACGGALSRATVAPATVASAMESALASKASPSPSSAAPCPALLAVGPHGEQQQHRMMPGTRHRIMSGPMRLRNGHWAPRQDQRTTTSYDAGNTTRHNECYINSYNTQRIFCGVPFSVRSSATNHHSCHAKPNERIRECGRSRMNYNITTRRAKSKEHTGHLSVKGQMPQSSKST